ncbi:MAG: hypothetical protein RIS88_2988 [Pseudomonadota bacterium]|jgi:hypothetical protein
MIHLATQASPNPLGWRPPAAGARADPVLPRRRRGGPAWPFLSRPSARPPTPDTRPQPGARHVGGS